METKLCRICGKLGQDFLHIFKTEGLRSKIETCLPIIVSPFSLLPDTICRECSESIENFYIFTKNCLQNIIVLEIQYNIQDSCLKSRQKKDRGCLANIGPSQKSISVQTIDYLDMLSGKDQGLEEYSANFPLTLKFLEGAANIPIKSSVHLVDYEIDTDSGSEENSNNGKVVVLGDKLHSFRNIDTFVDSMISSRNPFSKTRYFDDRENNLISEITQRKNLKRKNEFIENSRTKIFKMDSSNRRKNKIPKKLDELLIGTKEKTSNIEIPHETELSGSSSIHKNNVSLDIPNYNVEVQDYNMPVQVEVEMLSSIPQSCLLCDVNFAGPAAFATHVFETHGIDMADVVSSGSRESFPEKNKKKLPNLVKISDLKRNDSTEDSPPMEDRQIEEQPPTLLPSFVCPNCPAVFTSKSDLMLHLRLKHPQQVAHLCGVCLQQCSSYMNLKNHLQSCKQQHQITTRYVCQVCQYGDNNFKLLENHVLVHEFLLEACKKQLKMFDPAEYIDTNDNFENGTLSPASKGLNCNECGLNEFESFKVFSTHRRSKHSIFHCDLCNKFYGRNSHLWKHVNRLHKGHPSITCQLCYKTSASKYHLAQHFNKIHLTKGPRLKSLDAQLTEKELKEDFMSQKFQAFDFQSVKQSFMKQDLMEQEYKKNKDVEDNSTSEPEDESIANKTIEEEEKDDVMFKDEVNEVDSSQNPYTNIITNYTSPSYNHSDEDNSEQEDESTLEKTAKEEEPKEIDSSHNLYTNIITNYTPPLNEGEFKCLKCSKAFHKMVLLKKHKKNCRPKMQKDLLTRCKSCARIFKDRQSLAKHLVNYHSEYICEICSQKVQSKCEIVSHIRFQHPGCHLFCDICKNILRSQEDLQEHLNNHSESYICQFCADPLPSKIKLKMHILSLHRKILSLSCGICLKLFETQHVLRNHVTLVHKDQLTPLTSCPVCGKNYGSKWKTYDHLNKSHGRIFKACKTCLEVFDNDAQLQAHRDVTAHGGPGSTVAATCLRNSLMAHISTVIKDVVDNEVNAHEEGSYSGEENGDSDRSDDEYDNEQVEEEAAQKKLFQSQSSKISLLERRLLGKKLPEIETNNKSKNNTLKKKNMTEMKKDKSSTKKDEETDQINSPSNPLINSSKRTVYVNSNDPSYCEICFKTWPAKKHLWQHYIRCHKTVAATVCGICLKTNDNYEALQKHLCENHPTLLHGQGFGSNFICRICGRYHNASSKLRLHMVIHENFDWKLIENVPNNNGTKEKDGKPVNGFKEYKGEEPGKETYDDNGINYDSLIEQVECSSQSENEESDEQLHVDAKNDQGSSTEDDADTEDSVMSENSLQARMLQNMMTEKQAATKDPEYASSTDESNSSFTGESSEDEASRESLSSQGKFNVNSDTADSVLNSNMFRRKPEELDSAIKSISYECMEQVDMNVVDDFCELQSNCLNENEIESAVGSIL